MTENSDVQNRFPSANGIAPEVSMPAQLPTPPPALQENHDSDGAPLRFAPTVDKNLPISMKGYSRLAWLMARTHTSDLAIFRKFGELNMLNLLRLQAELQALQDKLEYMYNNSEVDTLPYQYSFRKMRQHDTTPEILAQLDVRDIPLDSEDEDYRPNIVHKLLKRIERKLKAYSE
jgi:hypothetical protein